MIYFFDKRNGAASGRIMMNCEVRRLQIIRLVDALPCVLALPTRHRQPKQEMASAETQPRFGQSVKGLLSDKVGSCSGDVIALTRQVLKGSRSQEVTRTEGFDREITAGANS